MYDVPCVQVVEAAVAAGGAHWRVTAAAVRHAADVLGVLVDASHLTLLDITFGSETSKVGESLQVAHMHRHVYFQGCCWYCCPEHAAKRHCLECLSTITSTTSSCPRLVACMSMSMGMQEQRLGTRTIGRG